jgi:hypothetical protein
VLRYNQGSTGACSRPHESLNVWWCASGGGDSGGGVGDGGQEVTISFKRMQKWNAAMVHTMISLHGTLCLRYVEDLGSYRVEMLWNAL